MTNRNRKNMCYKFGSVSDLAKNNKSSFFFLNPQIYIVVGEIKNAILYSRRIIKFWDRPKIRFFMAIDDCISEDLMSRRFLL